MKSLGLLIVVLIIFTSHVTGSESSWSGSFETGNTGVYTVTKNELEGKIQAERFGDGLGERSVDNEETEIGIISELTKNFDLVSGDRLELSVILGGDQRIIPGNDSDYHFVFIPSKWGNISYFSYLFNQTDLIQNLTGGSITDYSLSDPISLIVQLQELTAIYEWDNDGQLTKKTLTSTTGEQLIIEKGGSFIGVPLSPFYIMFSLFVMSIIQRLRK